MWFGIILLIPSACTRKCNTLKSIRVKILIFSTENSFANMINWIILGLSRAGHTSQWTRIINGTIGWTNRNKIIKFAGIGFNIESISIFAHIASFSVRIIYWLVCWAFRDSWWVGCIYIYFLLCANFSSLVIISSTWTWKTFLSSRIKELARWTCFAYILTSKIIVILRTVFTLSSSCIKMSAIATINTSSFS